MVLNYSVIYAGHGVCNQQFVHVAFICRIAALVLSYYRLLSKYVIFQTDAHNVIIQKTYIIIFYARRLIGEKVLPIQPITWQCDKLYR